MFSNIFSIDQSLTNSGISIYIDHTSSVISEKIKIPSKIKGVFRLDRIRQEIGSLFVEHGIKTAVIEDYAYAAKYRSHQIGEMGGIIKLLCFDSHIPCITMPIGIHKKFTTGNGNASKDLVIKAVENYYFLETKDDNIADSRSILETYLAYLKFKHGCKDYNESKTECLKKLDSHIQEFYKDFYYEDQK